MLKLKVTNGPTEATLDALKEASIWDLGNEVLYRLCGSHPAHRSKQEIVEGRVSRGFPEGDSEYRSFVARSVVLRRWVTAKFGRELGPRDLDRVLLHY